jgi:hypothetical protein
MNGFRFPSGLASEPRNSDCVQIDCGDVQVFVAKAAFALPRRKPGVIQFTLPDVGWGSIELREADERGPSS